MVLMTWSRMPGNGMFDKILEFERALAAYTGARYAVMTDCCTHAIELCLRHDRIAATRFTAFTYLSIPMIMHKLGIEYELIDEDWQGEYAFHGTRIWDSARRLEPSMYRPGQLQCLSFGFSKPMATSTGRGGAVLLDDVLTYQCLLKMRYDGRDLEISPWQSQREFVLGYHYRPTIEEAQSAMDALIRVQPQSQKVAYPDCRKITIRS